MAYTTTDRFSEKCLPSSVGLDWLQELTTGVNFDLTLLFVGVSELLLFLCSLIIFAHSSWSIILEVYAFIAAVLELIRCKIVFL